VKPYHRRHARKSEPGATASSRTTTPIRRRFGQHFLSPAWAEKVVEAIAPAPGDVFLEIGPGRGALTLPLAATGVPILAVEIDRDLVKDLAHRAPAHVTLVTGDFLRTDVIPLLTGLQPQRPPTVQPTGIARRFRVVGNVPYNVSSPILFRLIDLYREHRLFTDATIMVQREVADRLVAEPGRKSYGVLTVSAQMHTRITRLLDLPPGAFRPPPKVRSSVVRLAFGPPTVRVPDDHLFDWLVRGLFSARRKTLTNAMKRLDAKGPEALTLSGLDGRRRPETLQVTELARLAEMLAAARRVGVL
jgi:16S rRNA (adenine1518-N6/adenine1519-N6)-dimethyltransferase